MSREANSDEGLSLQEVCLCIQVEEDWILELVAYGIVEPEGEGCRREEWRFQMHAVGRARRAARLHRDLGVNVAGLAVVLDLLEERERLRLRLRQLGAPPT